MKQVSKEKNVNKKSVGKANKKTSSHSPKQNTRKVRKHPKFGTSKLEFDFANEFLDKIGVEYQWQFEARDIGRFFDFYLPKQNLIIEIDGDYWHGNKEVYAESELKGFQRRAQRVDEYKTRWALMHGIPVVRFWESDIRKNPSGVMKKLREVIHVENEKQMIIEDKNKRHNNPMKNLK